MPGSEGGLVVEPLAKRHDRPCFSCGIAALDEWFHKRAGQDQKRNIARVFTLVEDNGREIMGFYSLSMLSIDIEQLPKTLSKKLPRYPEIPAGLIGRLAVSKNHQGQGLGKVLLFDALERLYRLSTELACYAAIVDAKDEEAERFYEKFGFEPFPNRLGRMFLPISTIKQIVEA